MGCEDKLAWRFQPDFSTLLELFRFPRRLVVVVHRSPTSFRGKRDRLLLPILTCALRRAAQLVVLDSDTLFSLYEMGFTPDQVTFLPYPVDHEFFKPSALLLGDTIFCPGDHLRDERIVSAIQDAGLAQVIRSSRNKSVAEYHGRLGNGVLVVQCQKMSEILDLYHRSRVVVLPVVPDVIPAGITAMLEAMSCQRVVVVPNGKAAAGNLEHGETGIVLGDRSPAAWVRCIHELWHSDSALERIGNAARKAIIARHSLTACGKSWSEVWRKASARMTQQ